MLHPNATEPARGPGLLGVRILSACAWLWLFAPLPFLTDVATPFPIGFDLTAVWLALACAWFCLPLTAPGCFRSHKWRRWWFAASFAGLTGLVLAFSDIGLIARLYLCESQLVAYVAGVAPDASESFDPPIAVGLFRVEQTDEYGGVVAMYTCQGFLNHYGVAHVPPGATPPPWLRRFRHLYGPWYSFEWKF